MPKKRLLMPWVHFGLAIFSLMAALDSFIRSMGWAHLLPLPQYVALLPVSLSMLLRSISEFNEAEKEYTELRNG
ncbi:MAG TPA: hypothetical protein VF491_10345 [Vicinamibacterales bacterium]